MFSSLKSKIIFFIAIIMAITAAAVMYFTHRDVELAMLRKEEVLAKNVLRMVELNIKGGYQKLLTNRLHTILRHKTQLKDLTAIASSIIGEFAALFKSGRLTEEEAQKKALDWLRSVKLKNESNWFVIDRNSTIIAHPDSTIEGMSITSIRDMK
jgi:sigma-B regulation protein RsbU (phosphoserine phosphatase)